MLKKIITVAFILSLANQVSVFAEMTPLQLRVRSIFSEIRNRDKAEVAQIEEVEEEKIEVEENKTPVSVKPAKEEIPTQIILASDQDDVDDEDYDDEDEEEEIVVATAPKTTHEVKSCEDKPKYELKTAAEVSSKDRKAQINKKWSFEVLGWNTELDGHIKIAKDEDSVVSDDRGRIDFKNDTSLDKKKVPGLKLAYSNGGRSSFEFNWVNIEQDGHLNNGIEREFKGKKYGANANFEINNAMYDLVWKYKFSHKVEESGREKSYVSGLLGVKASKMEFKFNGQAGEVDANGNVVGAMAETHESKSETIPVPYIGIEGGTYLGEKVYLKGYYRYLKLNNIKDYDAEHSDYDVSLSYKLSGEGCDQDIFLDVGYRQVVYDVEGDGNDVELKYKGPYVGLEFRF